MKISDKSWEGYIDLDGGLLTWVKAPPGFVGQLPVSESLGTFMVEEYLHSYVGLGEDFWEWVPEQRYSVVHKKGRGCLAIATWTRA